jgi:hypothetical protein
MRDDNDGLDESQTSLINRLQNGNGSIEDLRLVFQDPGDAFICSPVPLTMQQLVRMYSDQFEEMEQHTVPGELRRRSRAERWREKRAIFQSKRSAIRRDALLEAEAQVWAILGIEFHSTKIRMVMERWEALSAYVMTELEKCESGKTQFSTALRDACRELTSVEESLAEMMPDLNLKGRASAFWSEKASDREQILNEIQHKMNSIQASDRGEKTFELIRGGMD